MLGRAFEIRPTHRVVVHQPRHGPLAMKCLSDEVLATVSNILPLEEREEQGEYSGAEYLRIVATDLGCYAPNIKTLDKRYV